MAERRVVLVTGATGRIGTSLCARLADRYDLRSGHRRSKPDEIAGLLNPVYCKLDDRDSVQAAAEGVDTIVHLAANAGDRPFAEEMVPNNVVGPYHLCEAAVARGCRRIVFASTNHVVGNYLKEGTAVDETALPRPDSLYAVTKCYGEDLGRFYVERKGLPSFISLRIGAFQPEDAAATYYHRRWQLFHQWLTGRDFAQLVERCVEAPDGLGFRVYNATSGNTRGLLLLSRARTELGYLPEDDSEVGFANLAEVPEFLIPR